jgi:hypothetical protein
MAREEQSETEWQQKTLNEILLQSFNWSGHEAQAPSNTPSQKACK